MNFANQAHQFSVIPGELVHEIVYQNLVDAIDVVKRTYLSHKNKRTINPDSYFLKFPSQPQDRIIALPASISDGDLEVAGIKWIASFPNNINKGYQRASALLILNSLQDGYPYACLEASTISAVRTAASAVLGAYWLNEESRSAASISFVGAGIIAKTIFDIFVADHWNFNDIKVFDLNNDYASSFKSSMHEKVNSNINLAKSLEDALVSDIVVLATTSAEPYILPPISFKQNQIILNISLRDIAPELILGAFNIVDDIDHCLKASTSPHLAEQKCGNRDFIAGTLADLMTGELNQDQSRPKIYSPFGMGILDLALAEKVYNSALEINRDIKVPNFFSHVKRW